MSRYTVIRLLVLISLCACMSGLYAQISSVRVYTKPAGATFYVDDQFYTGEVTFLWPANSKHFIRTDPLQTGVAFKTKYTFGGATSNFGTCPMFPLPVTASPGFTYCELDFTLSYAATVSFFPCKDTSGCTNTPGTVMVNGTPYTSDGEDYFAPGTNMVIDAYPSSGWIFTGWGPMPGVPTGKTFHYEFPLNQPQVIRPLFQSARPIGISMDTNPSGLQLLIDRSPVYMPKAYEWGWGTDHEVGAVATQRDDHGHWMVFDAWSDGGPINHVYHMQGEASSPMALSARFVPGASVTFLTNPPGLTLSVDGRKNWQSYNFIWKQGSGHAISAPATQTDDQGRLYKFVSWSNGGTADQQYVVADAPDDQRITAVYQPVAQFDISSVPAGIVVQIDGVPCTTPCAIQRDVGSRVALGAPAISQVADGARLVFQGWTDSAAPNRNLVATSADRVKLNATYQLQYQLITGANPADAVQWSVSPGSTDGFYNADSVVAVSAQEQPGYHFLGWNGDASGFIRPLGVAMNAPKRISVMLDPVPFVDKGGVKNAAGDTPEQLVAPGSVISIVGVNLSTAEERGPASPLKQSLAGVTMQTAGLLMPLFFVTPAQINAQLPFEIGEGQQSLTLSVPGKADMTVDFTVARNAPGLFNTQVGDVAYAMASHADGSPVTLDSPAAKGETVTLFGTGFGPYAGNAPDGFALPTGPNFMLVDPVKLLVGDAEVVTSYAGAAAQKVGVNALTFTVDDSMPQGTNAPVKVRINGHESNTVILPLK
jgi:uncharacterized protein (TIGR03437 family)